MIEDSKIFFNPGDLVKVRHTELKNSPVMYVTEKVTRSILNKDHSTETAFIGIKCR